MNKNAPLLPSLRRRGLLLSTLAAAITLLPSLAQAAYPSKVVKVILPLPAGSPPDVVARLWAERVSKATGQAFIIDNRAGAATIIGAQAVASAPADGYTLLYTISSTISINPYVYKTLPYKPEDFEPISRILTLPLVLVVSANSPLKTAADLIKAAKAAPGKMNYASYGQGQPSHVTFARFLNMAGISMTHVPYKDGGIPDIIAGNVDASFDPSNTAIPMITGGRLRALAVTSPQRLSMLPDVPTVAEFIPGFAADPWQGLFAPKGVPPEIVARLAALTQDVVRSEDFRARLRDLGMLPVGSSPAEFRTYLAEDSKAWAKVVRDNNIRMD
ncbi:MAG: tripartite tricarboxylate transporter substrate binding protein [Burkholderiaceae bacterium]|nr:tripartite tricarboxylate transporter substrate binding protein [Burkholderiaceae bacterium]